MRRIFWTLGMTLVGLFLAFKGQDVTVNAGEIAIGGIWAACIGYGLGSVFEKRAFRRNTLIAYWCSTMALVGAFFGPLFPSHDFIVQVLLGAVAGTFLGLILGLLHWRHLSNKPVRMSDMPGVAP